MEATKDVQAKQMFSKGYSIRDVASRLGVEFRTARQWKHELDALETTASPAPHLIEEPAPATEEPEGEEELDFNLRSITLTVPEDRLEAIFSTFTPDEQGHAIATILQQRLDKAIEAFDTTGVGENDGEPEETAA